MCTHARTLIYYCTQTGREERRTIKLRIQQSPSQHLQPGPWIHRPASEHTRTHNQPSSSQHHCTQHTGPPQRPQKLHVKVHRSATQALHEAPQKLHVKVHRSSRDAPHEAPETLHVKVHGSCRDAPREAPQKPQVQLAVLESQLTFSSAGFCGLLKSQSVCPLRVELGFTTKHSLLVVQQKCSSWRRRRLGQNQ